MSAALRIALAYFSIAPVQRWINGFGVFLILLSLLARMPDTPGPVTALATFLVMLGATLICFAPLTFGGMILRLASSRSVLHLRPHGRVRMLLGATLAITLIAGLVTLAMLPAITRAAAGWHLAMPLPMGIFLTVWAITALAWIGNFLATGSRLGMMLIWVVLVGISWLPKQFFMQLLGWPAFICGITGWMAFAWWYNTAAISHSWQWFPLRPESARQAAPDAALALSGSANQSASMAQRTYLLNIAAPQAYVLIGLCVVLLELLLQSRIADLDPALWASGLIIQASAMLIFMLALLARSMVSRARLLWLRTGANRAGLFALAERHALRILLLLVGIPLLVLALIGSLGQPDQILATTLVAAVQAALATALMYWALALTRGWNAGTVLQTVCVSVACMVHIVLLRSALGPPAGAVTGELIALVPFTWLLRRHARRRWLSLDWRVARLPLNVRSG